MQSRYCYSRDKKVSVEAEHAAALNAIVDRVYEKASLPIWKQQDGSRGPMTIGMLADRSGLSASTVSNLLHRWTYLPRLLTVQRLCKAVDIELGIVKDVSPVTLRKRKAG